MGTIYNVYLHANFYYSDDILPSYLQKYHNDFSLLSPLYIPKVEDYSIIDTNIIIEDISFEISVSIEINDFYHDYDDELCGAL